MSKLRQARKATLNSKITFFRDMIKTLRRELKEADNARTVLIVRARLKGRIEPKKFAESKEIQEKRRALFQYESSLGKTMYAIRRLK